MSVIIQDGFDTYAAAGDLDNKWVLRSTPFTVNTTGGRFGGGSIEGVSSYSNYGTGFVYSFPSTTTARMAFSFRTPDNSDSDYWRFSFNNIQGSSMFYLNVYANQISTSLRNNNGDSISSELFNWSQGSWHWIEAEAQIGAPGKATLYVDGNKIYEETKQIYDENVNTFDQFAWYNYRLGGGTRLDDLVLWNDDGVGLSYFPLGDSRIYTQFVSAAGSNSDFTPVGETSNELNVDDQPAPDGDATYNSSSTVGHRDLFAVSSLPATPTQVHNVQVNAVVKKDNTGERGAATVIKSGATVDVSQGELLTPGYRTQLSQYAKNPDTNSEWSASELNNLEIGYEVSS